MAQNDKCLVQDRRETPMFIIVTVITLVALIAAGGAQAKPAAAAFMLYLPFWWIALLIYALWLMACINSFIAMAKRWEVLQYISKYGSNANMRALNMIVCTGAFLLIIVGWGIANRNMLITGIIVGSGVVGNAWEQRSIL